MEFLRFKKPLTQLLYGGLILLLSCTGQKNPVGNKQYTITMDSVASDAGIQDVYDYGSIVQGLWFMTLPDDHTYVCAMKNGMTLIVRNIDDATDSSILIQADTINSFIVRDQSIYCVTDNKSKITILDFVNGDIHHPLKDSCHFPKLLNDTFFNSSNLHAPMVVGQRDKLFIPYKADNGSPNMLDTCAYLLVYDHPVKVKKIVRQPEAYLQRAQFMNKPIGVCNTAADMLYYTFESIPALFACNLATGQSDATPIADFTTKEFNPAKQTNFTYIRNYIAENDANRRLFYDNGHLYLFKRNAAPNTIKYTLYCYDSLLHPLTRLDIKARLNTEAVFLKNHKLYVYAHKSDTKFYTFQLIRKL
jgi:hypothetical protein